MYRLFPRAAGRAGMFAHTFGDCRGIFLFLTMGMGIYIAFDIFNGTNTVEGWLSTMSFLAFGFFGVFALLTIILKYLSVLLNLIFRQQRYLVSDIEKVVKN